jgi:hypothetical protein
VSLLGLALGLLAVAIIGYAVALAWGRVVMARRARHHDGTYAVRLVPSGGEPRLLGAEFGSAASARAAATETLVEAGPGQPVTVGQVLARRHDGTWDVVDEVHVLG